MSLAESTFFGGTLLSFGSIGANPLVFSIIAYFLGQLCHTVGSALHSNVRFLFENKSLELSDGLYRRIRKAAEDVYDIKIDSKEHAHRRELYPMADAYVVAAGHMQERDSLLAREGFAKTSMVAFLVLTLVLLCAAVLQSGLTFQAKTGVLHYLPRYTTLMLSLFATFFVFIFRHRFVFFNRVKIHNTQILFLALVSQNTSRVSQTHNLEEKG